MSARRRIVADRGPLTGAAATVNAWRLCNGCRHPWFRHCYGPNPGCTTLVPPACPPDRTEAGRAWSPCPCPGFHESEE